MRNFRMIVRIGTKTHFSHFQSYENSPVFCMNLPTGDGQLKLLFPLLHAFHASGKSFKTQIKELR
ncbi:hypothetical protein PVL29_020686 [Vitis rotundifolia]|uniref:Uncharacterized protein n=1 Tax=Vitis rotundifolia TaxID=103349 RepID=A0AA38YY23_VITRO|nr:hypothetical protein PVL29_020686 [Vitis rotundifolia]